MPPFLGVPRPGEISAALQDDRRHRAEGLDVIQNGGRLISARHRRKRRTNAGHAALAFERFEQRRFFAALIGARARMRRQMKFHAAPENVVAQIAARVGFVNGAVDDVDQVTVFAANVDIALLRARPPGPR